MVNIANHFARLARYHVWANRRLLEEHLALLGDEEWRRDGKLFFGSIHGTLNHLLVAETTWYARFAEGDSPRIPLDRELHADRCALADALTTATERWQPWITALDGARFDGELAYHRSDGEAMRLPFTQTLGHVFNHATHHRGQISAALTAMGRPAPELDWVRQLQDEARTA